MNGGRPEEASEISPGLAQVIGRALTDPGFREALFTDRQSAVAELRLSAADQEALDSIPRETIEERAAQFSEGSAAAMTISIVIKGKF